MTSLSEYQKDLNDEIVGIAAISDCFMVVTKRGKLYRVFKDFPDAVAPWGQIPLDGQG